MQEIKKIVVIGPESTGKSTLCSQLAAHYQTAWCAEYAREYLLQYGTAYTFEDLLVIAKGQLQLEDECVRKVFSVQAATNNQPGTAGAHFLFIDTDMYVMKVWCEYVFGRCHQLILDEIVQRKYDMYLLCRPDIAWVKDGLREYPDEKIRTELYAIYKDLLINQAVPWVEISGDYNHRLAIAIGAIRQHFLSNE